MGDQAVAGLGAGVAVSFLACPTELIKCRIQAQGGAAAPAQACTCHMRLRMLQVLYNVTLSAPPREPYA